VAKDVAKGVWRTFRADRVLDTRTTGSRTEPLDALDAPDAEAFVAEGISSVVYPIYTTVRLPLPVERAQEVVPPTIGTHTSEGSDSTIVVIGGNDMRCVKDLGQVLVGYAAAAACRYSLNASIGGR
jgi:hypothetical protein